MAYQLGVDIGTTHTAAAVLRSGRAEMVSLDDDSAAIPSVVFLETDGTVVVGESASQKGFDDPAQVARCFKRRMDDSTAIVVGGTTYSGGELMAKMLRRVVDIVTAREGAAPDLVTVTHPAAPGADRANLMSKVIELAGLESARTLSDPEAAAIHHHSTAETAEGDVVVVYDLGGGTFDVSVARMTADGAEIVGTVDGIDHLGGIDFDEAVLDHISEVVGIDKVDLDLDDPSTAADLDRLRGECAAVKVALSTATKVSVPVFVPGGESEIQVTRGELEAMVRPALTRTIEVLRRTLASADVEPPEVDAVVLLGGSSRIPLVARMVSEELGRPVAVAAEPKDTVALGAALSMVSWAEEHGDAEDADGDDADGEDAEGEGSAAGDPDADSDETNEGVVETGAVPVAGAVASTASGESASSSETGIGIVTDTAKSGSADGTAVKEKRPKRPPPPPMSLLTSIAAVLAAVAMVAAAVGAGTLIAVGEVGIGVALVVAGVAACVALVLMLRRPSEGSSS